MRKLLLAIILFYPTEVLAQGYRIDNVVLNSRGQPVPNPTVTVCTSTGTGIPCTPLATVYTSATLATAATNPLPIVAGSLSGATGADAQGNYGFWVPPTATYIVTITSPQISPGYTYTITVPPSAGGNNAFTGANTFGNTNKSEVVDGVRNTTIAQAVGRLPSDVIGDTGNSYVHGTVYLPFLSGGYTVSSNITVSPFLKIIGEGMEPVVLNCPTAATCFTWNNLPFTVKISDGGFYNVTFKGDGSANQIGLAGTNATGLVLSNVRFYGFSGSGAVGTALTNTTNFTERTNFNRVWWFNNATNLQLNGGGTSSTNSFGHQTWIDLEFNLETASQIAILLTSNATLYSSTITGVVNNDLAVGTDTVWNLAGTSTVGSTVLLSLLVDNNGGGTVTGVQSVAGTSFNASGNFSGYTSNSGVGTLSPNLALPTGMGNVMAAQGLIVNGAVQAGIGGNILTLAPAASGFPPLLQVSGADTNITLNVVPKGTGVVQVNGDQVVSLAATQTLTNKSTSAGPLTGTVVSGSAVMTTAAIAAGACGTTVTVAATGVAITDAIAFSFSGAPAATSGELPVSSWPTAGNVNFQYCNPGAASVTPAAATLNWRVVR